MDNKGAIIGGLVGGPAGAVVGGSGLFSKKKVPTYDPSVAIGLAKQGQDQENNFINSYVAGNKANNVQLQGSVDTAKAAADQQSRDAAQGYLSNYDPIQSKLVQSRTDQLKQQLFGQIPELVQASREAGAAGGGLDRGVTQSALAQIPVQQAQQFNTGATNLANTALQGQLDARGKVYDSQNQLILTKLGIDNQTAEAILNSGNQALIEQLNSLIDNSRNSIGLQINANNAAQGSNIGAAQNENANKQAIINGLIGIGGTVAGAAVGGPAGAAVGGKIGSVAAPAISGSNSNATTFAPNQFAGNQNLNLRRF